MHFCCSIGFAIARRLLKEGASVVVSSRKQKNVEDAVRKLQTEGLKAVTGIVCHVAKEGDRSKLFDEVWFLFCFVYIQAFFDSSSSLL